MGEIAILGCGMAGLGAAWRLAEEGRAATVYDKNPYPGGHTASFRDPSGFVFDDGPHISFTRNERVQGLLADSVGGEYEILQASVDNYWRGHRIKHPAQCNLHGLPVELVARVLEDFIAVQHGDGEGDGDGGDGAGIENYEDWLIASFGRAFAETFPMEYGHKYHTVEARGMSTDWLGPRLYRPKLDEVLVGALAPDTADVHYVDHFRYPSAGGFDSYLRAFLDRAEVRLEREVMGLDPGRGEVRFAGGEVIRPSAVISSLPLPALIERIDGVPAEVAEAAARLAVTTCVLVNVGVAREDLSPAHWTYFYDRDVCFTRISYPHMFSPGNAPPGTGSIQVELYFSDKYRPLDAPAESYVEPVIRDLIRCNVLREDDEILFRSAWVVPTANVIFDHDRAAAVARVHGYLDEIGLAPCGRYGLWGYQWTDESFVSGEEAAQRTLDGLRYGAPALP